MNKEILKYEGIDDWGRPVFKDSENRRFGSVDKIFSGGSFPHEVIKALEISDLCYFGRRFGCEPDGDPINTDRYELPS